MRVFGHEFGHCDRLPARRSGHCMACSTKTRAEACQVWPAANSTQSCREICSAARQAARRSSSRTPTGAAPITSRGPVTGKAATGRPLASASSSTRPNVSVLLGKHENIGGRIDLGQFLAVPRAEKHGVRIFPLQRRARRPVADDQLGAGQIEVEKRLEILFDRDAADAEEHRRRQAEVDAARMKQRGIDAARPQHHIAKAAHAQFGRQRRRRRHHRLARPVEGAQRRPDPGFRDRRARGDIFRKAGVKARGERQTALAAIAPHQTARSGLRSRYECCRAAPPAISRAIFAGYGSASRRSG